MSTFGQLKTDIDNWLARDDVAVSGADIGSIILLGEAEIAREIRCVVQEQRTTLVTGATRFVDLPSDFIQMRQQFIDSSDGRGRMEYQTPEAIRKSGQWNGQQTIPTFYTIEGGDDLTGTTPARLVLAPPPDGANPQNIDILYWARFAALSADPDTNWLLQNYYDVYLWQMLKQAAIYLQETELATQYGGRWLDTKESVRRTENRKRFMGSSLKSYNNPRTII